MSADMELQGFEEIAKKLEQMGKVGSKIENEALIKSAEPMLEDVKNTTAYKDRTGKLRKSMKMSRVKTAKDGKYIWIGDVDREAPYSWYVEFTHPFLRTAYETNKDEILNIIKDEMEKGLKYL